MIEVELKYRLDDPESLLAALLARGAQSKTPTVERDLYFNHPSRDFRETDEALRLRWDGANAVLTYKGELLDRVSKSREELELDLAAESSLEIAKQILTRLGFVEVREVVKRRTTFPLHTDGLIAVVTVDEVDGLGLFAELETGAEREDYEKVRDRLIELAGALGLTQGERRSYLQLLMEREAGAAAL